MLASILIVMFIVAFIAVVAYGHVLLIAAVWPESASRSKRLFHMIPGMGRRISQPK